MKMLWMFPSTVSLALLLACGGGDKGDPLTQTDKRLTYTDPASGTYLLKVDPARSTPGHLVLNLVGPKDAQLQGVRVGVEVDAAKAHWATPDPKEDPPTALLQNGNAFTLGNAPHILKAQAESGRLQATVANKVGEKKLNGDEVLLRLCLELKKEAPLGDVKLEVARCEILGAGKISPMDLKVGRLEIKE